MANRAPMRLCAGRRACSALATLALLASLQACSPHADPPPPAPGIIKPTRDQIISRIQSAPMPPDKKAEALRKFEQENPPGGKSQ